MHLSAGVSYSPPLTDMAVMPVSSQNERRISYSVHWGLGPGGRKHYADRHHLPILTLLLPDNPEDYPKDKRPVPGPVALSRGEEPASFLLFPLRWLDLRLGTGMRLPQVSA